MSYIDLMNGFWRMDRQESFNGNQTRLYFLFLNLANTNHWKGDVVCSDRLVSAYAGVSINTLKRSREVLRARGLIGYTVGGKGMGDKTRYQILTAVRTSEQIPTPYYKKIKTKDINNGFSKKQKGFDISSGDFD